MPKVTAVIFTTSRYEYLLPMLMSLKENVDFSDFDVHWMLIDDYPLRRDPEILDMIKDLYQIDQLVLNEENLGYSGSWAKAWKLLPEDTDYIWHQEEDFIFEEKISVADMIKTFEASPVKLSQLFLKRNICYAGNNDFVKKIEDGNLGKDVRSNNKNIVAFRYTWFISHPGIYPYWITKENYEYNPQEGIIASYLNHKYPDLYSGMYGARNSYYKIKHIGDYNQGKKCLPGEPGWNTFGKYDPAKQYYSLSYLTEYSHSHNFAIAELCEKCSRQQLALKYYQKCFNSDEAKDQRYLSAFKLAHIEPENKFKYYSAASTIYPERLEAWYHLMILYKNIPRVGYGYGLQGYEVSYINHKDDKFLHKSENIYNGRFIMEFCLVAYYSQHYNIALKAANEFTENKAENNIKAAHASNMKFYLAKASLKNELSAQRLSLPAPGLIIIDNYLKDPDKEREFALAQEYSIVGNYPGKRTQSFATNGDKNNLETILGRKINYWPGGYNGCYQYCFGDMTSWIHRDNTDYSAILFLTPNAPVECGTTIFNHKESNKTFSTSKELSTIMDNDGNNEDKWDVCDVAGNRYNRLIIFCGKQSHRSSDYFGSNMQTARLFKIFFFNVDSPPTDH